MCDEKVTRFPNRWQGNRNDEATHRPRASRSAAVIALDVVLASPLGPGPAHLCVGWPGLNDEALLDSGRVEGVPSLSGTAPWRVASSDRSEARRLALSRPLPLPAPRR